MAAVKYYTADTLIILVAADYDFTETDLSSYSKVYLFANKCNFGAQAFQAQELHVHANGLAVTNDGAIITTSGSDGTASSPDGASAFPLFFSTANFETSVPAGFDITSLQPLSTSFYPLKLQAEGGKGAKGQDGVAATDPGGPGGNGGNGAAIHVIMNSGYAHHLYKVSNIVVQQSPMTIDLSALKTWTTEVQAAFTQPLKLVADISSLSALLTSASIDPQNVPRNIVDAFETVVSDLQDADTLFTTHLGVFTGGGLGGDGGTGIVNGLTVAAASGMEGSSGDHSNIPYTSLNLTSCNECLYHPDQVQMMVREIEYNYYVGSDSSLKVAASYINTLLDTLNIFGSLTEDDALWQAYAKNEQSLFIIPADQTSAGSAESTPTSIASFRDSLKLVTTYNNNMNLGLDFYGNQTNWVPRGSVNAYTSLLSQAMLDFNNMMTAVANYNAIADDWQKRSAQITQGQAAAMQTIVVQQNLQATLTSNMTSNASEIEALQIQIVVKRKKLAKKLLKLDTAIQNTFDVSFTDFVGLATQIAFAPTDLSQWKQGASMLYKGIADVDDDSGVTVSKAYLVKQIKAVKTDFNSLKETVAENGDLLSLSDPGATKLIASTGDIMALVSKYTKVLGHNQLNRLQDDLQNYVRLVLQRNNLVVAYNVFVTEYFTAQSKLEAAQKMSTALNNKSLLEGMDYNIPALDMIVERAYFETTNYVLKLLYDAGKALCFWTIDTPAPDFSAITAPGFPDDNLGPLLSSAHTSLIQSWGNAIEAFGSDAQSFGSLYPGNAATRLVLSESQLETFKKTGVAQVTIDPIHSWDTKATTPFALWCDIRVQRVDFYVEGLMTAASNASSTKTPSSGPTPYVGQVSVYIQHTSPDVLVDANDKEYTFTRDGIDKATSFSVNADSVLTPVTQGDIAIENNSDSDYAAPALCATWTANVSTETNTGLSLGSVTSAWFDFSGKYRAFNNAPP